MKKIPSHRLVETSDPNLFRLINRKGDWVMYYDKKADKYLWAVNHLLEVGYNKGNQFVQWLLGKSAEEAQHILEDAGNRGSRVHAALADLVNGHSVNIEKSVYKDRVTGQKRHLTDDEWRYLLTFVNFVEDYKPISISLEQSIGSVKLGWAGTYDWVCTIEIEKKVGIGKNAKITKKRIKVLIDFKTSSAIHDSYNLQLAAYWLMLKELKMARGLHTAVLRLGSRNKRGYEFKLWSISETVRHARIFRGGVREIFSFKEGTPEPKVTEFPSEISVKIPSLIDKNKKTKKHE